MKDISKLQNVELDRDKLGSLLQTTPNKELKRLLQVGDSQVSFLRRGERGPSADGLLKLMMLYGLKPQDLAVEK